MSKNELVTKIEALNEWEAVDRGSQGRSRGHPGQYQG